MSILNNIIYTMTDNLYYIIQYDILNLLNSNIYKYILVESVDKSIAICYYSISPAIILLINFIEMGYG